MIAVVQTIWYCPFLAGGDLSASIANEISSDECTLGKQLRRVMHQDITGDILVLKLFFVWRASAARAREHVQVHGCLMLAIHYHHC